MGAGGSHGLQIVPFLTANLMLYTCWIIFSAYAGTFKPPGSSFPFFFLGYALAGVCWVLVGYGFFDWSAKEASKADLLLIALAGACACSGTMFLYRALAASSDANRSIVYIVAAAYPAVTFSLAIAAGVGHSSGALSFDTVKQFATKLGYDPGNVGKNIGLGMVLVGGVLIAAFTKRS
jgi:hypothetical protein